MIGDEDERGAFGWMKLPAKAGNGLIEAVSDRGWITFGPEEFGKLLARVGTGRVQGQKRKECARLLRLEAVHDASHHVDPQSAQQLDSTNVDHGKSLAGLTSTGAGDDGPVVSKLRQRPLRVDRQGAHHGNTISFDEQI